MADLSVTAANVLAGSGATIEDGTCGEAAVTAGMSMYWKTSDRKWYMAQHDGTAAASGYATGSRVGISLNGAAASQPIKILREGNLTAGATVGIGTIYYVGTGYGGICAAADLATGDYVTLLGVGTTTAIIKVSPIISGVQVPA